MNERTQTNERETVYNGREDPGYHRRSREKERGGHLPGGEHMQRIKRDRGASMGGRLGNNPMLHILEKIRRLRIVKNERYRFTNKEF